MIGNKKAMSAQMGEHVEDLGDTASRMYMAVVRFVRRSVRFVWQQFRCEDSVSLEDSHADTAFWSAALMWKAHVTSLGGLMECSVRWGLHLTLPGTLGGWEPLRGLDQAHRISDFSHGESKISLAPLLLLGVTRRLPVACAAQSPPAFEG